MNSELMLDRVAVKIKRTSYFHSFLYKYDIEKTNSMLITIQIDMGIKSIGDDEKEA